MLPAETLLTSWTNGSGHRTPLRFAAAFVHDITAFQKVRCSQTDGTILPEPEGPTAGTESLSAMLAREHAQPRLPPRKSSSRDRCLASQEF